MSLAVCSEQARPVCGGQSGDVGGTVGAVGCESAREDHRPDLCLLPRLTQTQTQNRPGYMLDFYLL